MASFLFKRFFEIRLLHEYYFVQEDGASIFDKDRSDWDSTLADKVIKGRYDITDDLSIEPTTLCKKQLSNYHIRFSTKPTGFILSIEVRDNLLTPRIDFEEPKVFQFLLITKNPHFKAFTNELSVSSSYYFSNHSSQLGRTRNAPMLSNTVAAFSTKKTYKMGELSLKAGKLQIARKTTNSGNASDWMPLSDQSSKNTYVNAQDVCQFSSRTIQFQTNDPISKLVAKLSTGSDLLKAKTISLNSPSQTVSLNFSSDDNGNEIADGLYVLTVSYNDKAEESTMVYFSDTLAAVRPYALIEISTNGDGDFKLLTNGKLVRNTSTGKHPVFDILFKSRATYWRYRSSFQKPLKKPTGYDFLVEKDPDLVTVDPHIFSAEMSSFQNSSNTTVLLPSPDVSAVQQGDGVFYADVFIPKV